MKVFKNENGQIRSGWKIAIVIFGYQISSAILGAIVGVIGAMIFMASKGINDPVKFANEFGRFAAINPVFRVIIQGVSLLAVMLIVYIALRTMDKKRFKDIGFTNIKNHIKELGIGFLIGAVSMTLIFIVLYGTGNITLTSSLSKPDFTSAALFGFITFIFVGIGEEVLSRGYCITILNQMGKPWLSVVISSFIFSSLHLLNPNVKVFGLINIAFVGILFGYMYVKSGNLWMPIGYHISWNYFQGNVFGFPVSGTAPNGIYTVASYNDNILTGGAFGPEAGILTTIVIALGLVAVWKMNVSRDDYLTRI